MSYDVCFRISTKSTYKMHSKDSMMSQEVVLASFELWNLEMNSKWFKWVYRLFLVLERREILILPGTVFFEKIA